MKKERSRLAAHSGISMRRAGGIYGFAVGAADFSPITSESSGDSVKLTSLSKDEIGGAIRNVWQRSKLSTHERSTGPLGLTAVATLITHNTEDH
ncbi:MAG: hypothetical protein QW514_06845 [Thermoprotei archaeon]